MNHSRPYLLVDTNIWLDFFDPKRPCHQGAVCFVEDAYKHDAELLYAITSSKDLYYLFGRIQKETWRLEKKAAPTPAEASALDAITWDVIENLNKFATPVACDSSDIWLAQKLRNQHGDYEDNLVIAAALRAKVDYLVTKDKKLQQHCPVACADTREVIEFIKIQQEPKR